MTSCKHGTPAKEFCAPCFSDNLLRAFEPVQEQANSFMRAISSESDPHGIDQHAPGAKLDAGKPQPDLVLGDFALALSEVTKVGTFGAQKYSPSGWRHVPDGHRRYSEAMLRHWLEEKSGSEHDAQTGITHAAHLAWNALARLELQLRHQRRENNEP